LIAAVLAGEGEAAREFVARFSRFVYAILARDFRLRPDVVDDLFQDVFVRLYEGGYRRLRLWRGDGDFARYLGPIVRHIALDHVQTAAAASNHEDDTALTELVAAEPDPEELAALRQRRDIVERAVETLSSRDKELYRLRYVEARKHREIARILDMTVSHVGVALLRLERRLERRVGETRENMRFPGRARPRVRSGDAETSLE